MLFGTEVLHIVVNNHWYVAEHSFHLLVLTLASLQGRGCLRRPFISVSVTLRSRGAMPVYMQLDPFLLFPGPRYFINLSSYFPPPLLRADA